MEAIRLKEKYALFDEHWTPHIIGECNGQFVKIAKVKGKFVWHDHQGEDELFYVVKGQLIIDLENHSIELNEGEMTIIPKGVKHRPRTEGKETWIMLMEPKSTKHTGDVDSELTKNQNRYL
jgi:mannose-6-phosphate isomerase-like protein (cupin superfamily)